MSSRTLDVWQGRVAGQGGPCTRFARYTTPTLVVRRKAWRSHMPLAKNEGASARDSRRAE